MGRLSVLVVSCFLGFGVFPQNSVAQAIGGGGSGGGGLRTKAALSTKKAGCTEGRKSTFLEIDPITTEKMHVVRTCRKGSYYNREDYIYVPRECVREGARFLQEILNKKTGKIEIHEAYCRDGKVIKTGKFEDASPWESSSN